MEKVFLTYINVNCCESYTLTGTVNDQFVDIDASERFFHIPVKEGDNSFNLKINYHNQNDQFQAIPMCFTMQNINNKKRLHIFQSLSNHRWHIENQINWLGSESTLFANLLIKTDLNESQKLFINNDLSLPGMAILEQDVRYKPNSWLVCYLPRTADLNIVGSISFRIDQKFYVSPISEQERFNYVTIGNKTIMSSKVLFYQKINSVFDYLNCLKIGQLIASNVYY